jgi:hypothetical protein
LVFNWTFCQLLTEKPNLTALFKKCRQLFEYQNLLLLRDIWWGKL